MGIDQQAQRRGGGGEGLRARKKRLQREALSDEAARLFLARGFDGVRVADVAAACGVSEKTVFNYFPTKEALVMDRLEATSQSLNEALSDPTVPVVESVVGVLDRELGQFLQPLGGAADGPAADGYRRFGKLIRSTPSLRAYQAQMLDRFVDETSELLSRRSDVQAQEPERRLAAIAVIGLWQVQFSSLGRHWAGTEDVQDIRTAVAGDVLQAARLVTAVMAVLSSPRGPQPSRYRHL